MDIQEIAEKLQVIVQEAEIKAVRKCGANWKDKYECLTDNLRQMRNHAESQLDDMKANGLTAGSIEAEGFLRCAIMVCNEIEWVDGAHNAEANLKTIAKAEGGAV